MALAMLWEASDVVRRSLQESSGSRCPHTCHRLRRPKLFFVALFLPESSPVSARVARQALFVRDVLAIQEPSLYL